MCFVKEAAVGGWQESLRKKTKKIPETKMFAPEKRPGPEKETRKYSNHPFSGVSVCC